MVVGRCPTVKVNTAWAAPGLVMAWHGRQAGRLARGVSRAFGTSTDLIPSRGAFHDETRSWLLASRTHVCSFCNT